MISNSEIRRRSREVLGIGLFTGGWLYPVLVLLIVGAISGALAGTYVGPMLVSGLLAIASAGYFLARVRGQAQPQEITVAVDCVKRSFVNSILASLLVAVFVTIGTFIFIVPGILFSYSFSMVYHVMIDRPELGPMEALKESRRLMRGHRWQLFCLQFSFIGWHFLGALCLGIGSLWSSAYATTANSVFYDELVANDRGYFTVNDPTEEPKEGSAE